MRDMTRAAPPRKKRPAKLGGKAGQEKEEKTQRTTNRILVPEPAPIKQLIAHRGNAWLFKIIERHRSYYVVERQEQVWRFSLLFQAEGKFQREASKPCRAASQGA
jgi:hypothetical protein